MFVVAYLVYTLAVSHAIAAPVAGIAVAETMDVIIIPETIHIIRTDSHFRHFDHD